MMNRNIFKHPYSILCPIISCALAIAACNHNDKPILDRVFTLPVFLNGSTMKTELLSGDSQDGVIKVNNLMFHITQKGTHSTIEINGLKIQPAQGFRIITDSIQFIAHGPYEYYTFTLLEITPDLGNYVHLHTQGCHFKYDPKNKTIAYLETLSTDWHNEALYMDFNFDSHLEIGEAEYFGEDTLISDNLPLKDRVKETSLYKVHLKPFPRDTTIDSSLYLLIREDKTIVRTNHD